jgi:UDP-N-acetylmuramyl pentapeptide synthase
MLGKIKHHLYFVVAQYFKYWAQIQLRIWQPHIVVVTGSNGKTTALHLLEAQLQSTARYSHHANSTYGVPFDILGLKRKTFSLFEWLAFFVLAPINAWKKPPREKVYVVEADAERPGEGRFLSSLLKPEIVIWLSSARTHSRQFESIVHAGKFATVDEAIAYEFGYFVERAAKLILANTDNVVIDAQRKRVTAEWQDINERDYLEHYSVTTTGTVFRISGKEYRLPYLLPKETFGAIVASRIISKYFDQKIDEDFLHFTMPPGRSSLFSGIKNTTIIDSSYNANLASVSVILSMVNQLSVLKKWAILGDLIEQGDQERIEHEKLADILAGSHFKQIILVGPRLAKYTLPKLTALEKNGVHIKSFIQTKDALDYLLSTLEGNEVLLFKGARFLEGIIEHLLASPEDVNKLCRREKIWQVRRKQWSL